MSDTVISVENLSKSYLIGHDGPQERYHSLRDTVVRHGKNYIRKAVDMMQGRQIIQGDEVEEFWALKDVSFEVKRGEVLGIIGRNGAGKSTLLKILSRITEPTSGRVTLNGRVASLLEVGTGFHPELTGRENIFLNGAILGMSKLEIRKKFDEIVDFAGVEKFLDTPVKRYSSGMYVRLAFAVAAHLEPEILIIDEVLAVGDSEFQKKCLGKMQDVARGGRTLLFVSHNMGAIRTLCSRGIMLDSGQIKSVGPIDEVLNSYLEQGKQLGVSSWHREKPPLESTCLTMVEARLSGSQPALELALRTEVETYNAADGLIIAFDISDSCNVTLMQALPMQQPFFGQANGRHQIDVTVQMPPLVPGIYYISVWIGTHFSSTVDFIETVVSFEISDSPQANRTFPHSRDHGAIAPHSKVIAIEKNP